MTDRSEVRHRATQVPVTGKVAQDHRSQADKFADLARAVEADEDEGVFDRALRRMKDSGPGEPEKAGE